MTTADIPSVTEYFCALPFHHTVVEGNGNFAICCRHPVPKEHQVNIAQFTYADWKSNSYLKEVQQAVKDNKQHPNCGYCWRQEAAGHESYRQHSTQEYKILGVDISKANLNYAELQLGNLCNLRCLMCNEKDSSAIQAENRRLGITKISPTEFKWGKDKLRNVVSLLEQKPKIISIRGGEPFYNKQLLSIIESLPDEQCRNTMLHISTNATIWDDRWSKVLTKFRLIRMMVSVDAVGNLLEYMRYPASWNQIENNISLMQKLPNVKLVVHCVVQNLNIGHLGKLISWANAVGIYLDFDRLVDPPHLVLTNLPDQTRCNAIDHLSTYSHIDFIQRCINELTLTQFDSTLWELFKKEITKRDKLRNNSYQEFLL